MTDGGENMKKKYDPPVAEKVSFNYKEQVVASGTDCYLSGQTVRSFQRCTDSHEGAMNK